VDILHASTRPFWQPEWPELGADLGLAGWVKRGTDAGVIAVGSVGLDIDIMSNVSGSVARSTGADGYRDMVRRFDRGDFDLMAVGRGQIGDPKLGQHPTLRTAPSAEDVFRRPTCCRTASYLRWCAEVLVTPRRVGGGRNQPSIGLSWAEDLLAH
jgi:hypothetical protein